VIYLLRSEIPLTVLPLRTSSPQSFVKRANSEGHFLGFPMSFFFFSSFVGFDSLAVLPLSFDPDLDHSLVAASFSLLPVGFLTSSLSWLFAQLPLFERGLFSSSSFLTGFLSFFCINLN